MEKMATTAMLQTLSHLEKRFKAFVDEPTGQMLKTVHIYLEEYQDAWVRASKPE